MIKMLLFIFILTSCKQEKLELVSESYEYELGEDIIIDRNKLLNNSEQVIHEVSIELEDRYQLLDGKLIESKKEYIDVGEVIIQLTFKDEKKEIKIVVKDTIAPIFTRKIEKLEIEENGDIDLLSKFSCKDLDSCEISYDTTLDLNQVGEHQVKVVASDSSGNQTIEHVEVIVNKKEEHVLPSNNQNNASVQNESRNDMNFAKEVLSIVNKERKNEGLIELVWDSNLASAADIRAREIQSVFSHTRPDGSECFTAVTNKHAYRALGENIASGYTTPSSVMDGWMNSLGHKENILYEDFTELGVSCFIDSNGRYHWVQMFGS